MARRKSQPPTPVEELVAQVLQGRTDQELLSLAQGLLEPGVLAQLTGPAARDDHAVPELPEPPAEPIVLQLRVDLARAKPALWRRLRVRGDLTLAQLHSVLQAVMGWEDYHLHRFWPGQATRAWGDWHFVNEADELDGEDAEGLPSEEQTRVDQVLRATGDRLSYTYDFGDDWHHTIKVEKVQPATEQDPPAVCVAGRGACPLEDCGGTSSHNEIVAALRAAPDGSTLEEPFDEWIPQGWDPAHFDVDQANLMIGLIGVDPEEILTALGQQQGSGSAVPAVDAFAQRLPRQAGTDFALLLAAALAGPAILAEVSDTAPALVGPRRVGELDARGAVRPWQLLLSTAGAEGIPLTQAGWMKPAVVHDLVHALGYDAPWIGKGNRENLVEPVADLRESAQRIGLLRKYKGHLVRTPRGRALDGDAQGLWDLLAASLTSGGDDFDSDARVLVLLHVAAGVPVSQAIAEAVTWLNVAGWQQQLGRHREPVDDWGVIDAVHPVTEALAFVSGDVGLLPLPTDPPRPPGQTEQALARAALFPGPADPPPASLGGDPTTRKS